MVEENTLEEKIPGLNSEVIIALNKIRQFLFHRLVKMTLLKLLDDIIPSSEKKNILVSVHTSMVKEKTILKDIKNWKKNWRSQSLMKYWIQNMTFINLH